jgi:hypothetical protein
MERRHTGLDIIQRGEKEKASSYSLGESYPPVANTVGIGVQLAATFAVASTFAVATNERGFEEAGSARRSLCTSSSRLRESVGIVYQLLSTGGPPP